MTNSAGFLVRGSDRLPKRRLTLFVAAFALATGAFWVTMLTDPPTTDASGSANFAIGEVLAKAPRGLPVQQTDAF